MAYAARVRHTIGAMDRNDLLRKKTALKNELQPILNQYHAFLAKI